MPPHGQSIGKPLPVATSIALGSLRAEMEARRAAGDAFSEREAVGLMIRLCTRLSALHESGRVIYAHPSSLQYSRGGGIDINDASAHLPPTLPRDRACLAPETRKGTEGDARASVFAVGAMLYEMLTNTSVGPGMRRPSEILPDLDPHLEIVLGKALVADATHRPHDLAALASALHHIYPSATSTPPAADESHLDHDVDFDVDVRTSMIPPSDVEAASLMGATLRKQHADAAGDRASGGAPLPPPRSSYVDPTKRLRDLKDALEADPRPRYTVVKHGMDHGPFTAVELLQQIASHAFVSEDTLRDSFSTDQRSIHDWEEFAPFAEQASLNRELVQERREVEAGVVAEKKGTQYKALVGATVLGVLVAGGLGLWVREQRQRQADLVSGATDQAVTVEVDAGLASSKRPHTGGGPRPQGGSGSFPQLSGGGLSCEAARDRYVEEYKMGDNGPADLTAGAYGAVLNRGSYMTGCGVPSSTSVSICAAVQNGRAVGVTVHTTPPSPGISGCIASAVRGLSFPVHPRLDVTTTTFAAN